MATFTRTTTSPEAYGLQPAGRATQLDKIYTGFVKQTLDRQYMGRLKVWIPELGGDPADQSQWFTMNYASPFAGATNIYANKNQNTFEDTQKSYGFWFVPPDLENEVLCCFVNGDPARGYWFACLFQQMMNHMVPGIPGQRQEEDATEGLPVAEYNKIDPKTRVVDPQRPLYTPLADALRTQGLDKDFSRGITTSGARRDSPASGVNKVNGILTPGGLQFVMDDNPDAKFIRLRTQTGAQVLISDSEGWIYMISADGSTWLELGNNGDIDMYGRGSISIRAQGDLNLRGDENVNIEAGRSMYIKARAETRNETGTFYGGNTEANPGTGNTSVANTSNTASVPAIGPQDTAAQITVPKNTVTGTFKPGMTVQGIPWNNPTVTNPTDVPYTGGSSSTVNTQSTAVASTSTETVALAAAEVTETTTTATTTGAGSGNPIVVVGDGVALESGAGIALQQQGTIVRATPGYNSGQVLGLVKANPAVWYAQWAVVSVGAYDLDSGPGSATSLAPNIGLFTSDLLAIRVALAALKYIWILPKGTYARDAVYGFATGYGDVVVEQGEIDLQTGMPRDFAPIISTVLGTIGQVIWPTFPQNTVNPLSLVNPDPVAVISSVLDDGDNLKLNVTFPPGNTALPSNGSAITGQTQPETTNNQPVANPQNSSEGGMIQIKAAKDLHMVSGRDMYQRSVGLTSRVAQKNMFDYSYGSYDQACGGYMAISSNGAMNLGSVASMKISAPRTDINGPAAQTAKAGPLALEPLDTYLRDNEFTSATEFKFVLKNTILSVLPFHEPYTHGRTTQGTNGFVTQGEAIDPATGTELRDGAITANQVLPLPVVGTPNKDSPAGNYQGTGYNDKNEPQYSNVGPVGNEAATSGAKRISQSAIQFFIKEEGKESKVYPDVGGQPTIGIGHLLLPEERSGNYVLIDGKQIQLNRPLSDGEIFALFRQDVKKFEDKVNSSIKAPTTQAQFDMLVSFCYNIGNVNSLAKLINAGNYNVSKTWMSFNKVRDKRTGVKKFNQAIYNRRGREYTIFANGYAYKA